MDSIRSPCRGEDRIVADAGERLVVDGVDLVARLAEHLGVAEAEVLVELQPHATVDEPAGGTPRAVAGMPCPCRPAMLDVLSARTVQDSKLC